MNHKIANASFFAVLMVAGIHTVGCDLDDAFHGSALWWWEVVGHYGLFNVAVPFFFICSGYFLAGHMQEDGWYKRECLKRVRTLLVPYVVWSLVFALLPLATSLLPNLMHGRVALMDRYASLQFWVNTFGLNPFAWPRLVPLWYVRTLLIFVAISPLLCNFIEKSGGIALLVCGLLSLALWIYGWRSQGRGYLLLTKCFNVSGLFYFCCGIYGQLKQIRLPKRGRLIALIAGLGLAIANGYCIMSGSRGIIPLWVPILLFGLWWCVPERPLPKWLTGASFAIYLLHMVIYRCLDIAFNFPVDGVLRWIVKWLIGVGGSLLVVQVLRGYYPKMANWVFGGR